MQVRLGLTSYLHPGRACTRGGCESTSWWWGLVFPQQGPLLMTMSSVSDSAANEPRASGTRFDPPRSTSPTAPRRYRPVAAFLERPGRSSALSTSASPGRAKTSRLATERQVPLLMKLTTTADIAGNTPRNAEEAQTTIPGTSPQALAAERPLAAVLAAPRRSGYRSRGHDPRPGISTMNLNIRPVRGSVPVRSSVSTGFSNP